MAGSPRREETKRVRLKVAQHNCKGSNNAFIILFHIVKKFDIFFVCVQDPPLYKGDPLRAPGYECIFQKTEKVQVSTYISLRVLWKISFVIFPCIEDVLYWRIFTKEGKLVGESKSAGIVNAYKRRTEEGNSVQAESLFRETNKPTIIVGDLNVHTSLTDPMRVLSSSERKNGETYMSTAALSGYTILNTQGIYTRFPDNVMLHRPSIINYSMANAAMFNKLSRWRDIDQRTSSDHISIVTELDSEEIELAKPAPNWEKSNGARIKENPTRQSKPHSKSTVTKTRDMSQLQKQLMQRRTSRAV